MLATFLRLSLSIELILYAAGGTLLWYYADVEPAVVLATALAIALGIRLVLVLFQFGIAWFYRSRRPPGMGIGLLSSVTLLFSELKACLLLYCVLQPFERWWMSNNSVRSVPGQPLVLLIHGFCCNAAFWWATKRHLQKQGIGNIVTLTLEPVFGDIDEYARQVAERIEQISALHDTDQIVLVGHSMGGLVARAYIHNYGGKQRVVKLITLGSPHQGSEHVRFAVLESANLQQMRPGNVWLAKLNGAETQPSPVPTVSIYSYHDNLVTPQESSVLPYRHVKNVPVAGIGHLQMAFSKRFWLEILQAIQEVSSQPVSDEQNSDYRSHGSGL